MPRTKREKVHYQRGDFRLVQRPDRSRLEISWYDPATRHIRYVSSGTSSVDEGSRVLDDKYLELTQGIECCPTCRRPYDTNKRLSVLDAIEVYLASSKLKPSYKALGNRLTHIVDYLETLPDPGVLCSQVDEIWVAAFRTWMGKVPVVSPALNERQRALSTIENSLIALASAIRHVKEEPQFKPIPTTMVNRTPSFRASVDDLGRMLRYALTPKKRRENLLAFLRLSILTMARPDAVHDANRSQWDAQHGIFNLNPRGRRQTKKYRATVPIAKQAVWWFEGTGPLVAGNAKKSMAAMSVELGLPGEGESGLKLIRRSMAHIVRGRLEAMEKPIDQLEVFLGHRVVGSVSELYAPFSASYLATAKRVVEEIIDELETLAPGAFHHTCTTLAENVIPLRRA